jgi:hypothetical protein
MELDMIKSPIPIIGLVAVDGTGKTTLARALVEHLLEYGPARLDSIKRPLSLAASAIQGIDSEVLPTEEVYHEWKKRPGFRQLMLDLGDAAEKYGGSGHLMELYLNRRTAELLHPHSPVGERSVIVLDDVRTVGQAKVLRDAGGLLVYLAPRSGQEVVQHRLNVEILEQTRLLCHHSVLLSTAYPGRNVRYVAKVLQEHMS